jgi:hypothetical protein
LKQLNVVVASLAVMAMAGCGQPSASSRSEAKAGTDSTGLANETASDGLGQTDESAIRKNGRKVKGGLENRGQLQSLRTPMITKPWGSDDPFEIHGLHHIFWATANLTGGTVLNYSDYNGELPPDIVGNSVRRVAISIRWDFSNVIPENPIAFEPHVAAAIENYARQGIKVTAVLSGVPAWARRVGCNIAKPEYCAPQKGYEANFGVFAGKVAETFAGAIDTFVIHNEVNNDGWYSVCSGVAGCNADMWIQNYAANFNSAYDHIKRYAPQANVLVSFDHAFSAAQFDRVPATLSVETFLKKFSALAGSRAWKVGYHPYPKNLEVPEISADDLTYGKITLGNIGALEGWLMRTFPDKPHAHEIFLTESGIARLPGQEQKQASVLCDSFKAVLGTPHVRQYLYYSFEDNPTDLKFGLVTRPNDSRNLVYHPAWSTFALKTRRGVGLAGCGYEKLGNGSPKIELVRGYHATRGHSITTRLLPAGFNKELSWRVERNPVAGTRPIYECVAAPDGDISRSHTFPSRDVNCEGGHNIAMGLLGFFHTSRPAGGVLLRRCGHPAGIDHLVLAEAPCSDIGWRDEGELGYGFP